MATLRAPLPLDSAQQRVDQLGVAAAIDGKILAEVVDHVLYALSTSAVVSKSVSSSPKGSDIETAISCNPHWLSRLHAGYTLFTPVTPVTCHVGHIDHGGYEGPGIEIVISCSPISTNEVMMYAPMVRSG